MAIKVILVDPDGNFPFLVEVYNTKRHFTKLAAIELKNKLQAALDELEEYQAMQSPESDPLKGD